MLQLKESIYQQESITSWEGQAKINGTTIWLQYHTLIFPSLWKQLLFVAVVQNVSEYMELGMLDLTWGVKWKYQSQITNQNANSKEKDADLHSVRVNEY